MKGLADSNEPKPLTIFTTGGTIEKTYDEDKGLLINRDSVLEERIHQKLRLPYLTIEMIHLLAKDSLFMTEEDRQILWEGLEKKLKTPHPIVILHGTDTVDKSIAYCLERLQSHPTSLQSAIVFTGAMIPLELEQTDGWQNLTEAISCSQHLDPGIYLSFHSRIYQYPFLIKDRLKKTFAYKP
jgi:L-asparaginase